MVHPSVRPETLRLISDDPNLAEQYRQAAVNHQVADLLDVRALNAQTDEQASGWRRQAARRRELGDQLLQQVLDRLRSVERGRGTARLGR